MYFCLVRINTETQLYFEETAKWSLFVVSTVMNTSQHVIFLMMIGEVYSHTACISLPSGIRPILFIVFLKLAANSRLSAPHSGSRKCLRFVHRPTFCTLNDSFTYL